MAQLKCETREPQAEYDRITKDLKQKSITPRKPIVSKRSNSRSKIQIYELRLYLNLDKRIKLTKQHKQELIDHYINIPCIHSNWSWDENGEKPYYEKMENIVIDYVDLCAKYNELIDSLEIRKEMFSEWTNTLTTEDLSDLGKHPNSKIDLKAYKIIRKIENTIPLEYRLIK